ncbi:LolA family protein [Desulfofalx alkaliphila]|uniref:LolA family protein n=1 Tax=Desulfofalx alkaliphila TaxID=105483 RepID=UPI000690D60C|nr:sigma-E factor regulatory protein RseB domain-containing protein [Desulfofalx alkaliphila]
MSKNSAEEKLSNYIDALNNEQHSETADTANDPELEKLLATARLVRSLREPVMPEDGYPQKLARTVAGEVQKARQNGQAAKSKPKSVKGILPAMAALAAGLLIFVLVNWLGPFNQDVVYAMEKAVTQLSNYHGILEMRTKNAVGEEWLVRQVELWAEDDKYAIRQDDGTLIINNGRQKWQISHNDREVALLPLLPDHTRNNFDLRDEAKRAKQYPHTIVGSELIAGRQATKLAISPPGGMEYYLWVDIETNLPIQLQTAMQNALQTTYTFVSFKPNTEIDPQIFTYQVPQGYRVVENEPGQLVATVEEAAAISGVTPLLPEKAPIRILAFQDRIIFDYGDTTITETMPKGDFEPAANASLGVAAGGPLEVWWDRLRWRQNGLEIQVEGVQRLELAGQIAPDLTVPNSNQDLVSKAQVKVSVDKELVEADQKQVDRGSSPWQLDPLQVSLTFVNLKVTPEGIQGEPEIPMSSYKVVANNSAEAVVEVGHGPIERVYLKRLVRQDETGIWSVVGYDPR